MSSKIVIPYDAIRELSDILKEKELSEIEYEHKGHRIHIAQKHQIIHMPTNVTPALQQLPHTAHKEPKEDQENWDQHPGVIRSPIVGTVYLSPEPGAPSFVKEGEEVKEGKTLLIIEAMKVMNPIKAHKSGKILRICVSETQPVEYDEPLIVIEI
ncbi:MAG: acetyl-CoA carboxylase biotin carboxyl carrier protein [Alphaproteobacteria bacterium]